jgi:hypothetical protein
MQLNESTDVGFSVLHVFMRYMNNNQIEEWMLMCKPLPVHTTEDIFKLIISYMTDIGLSWKGSVKSAKLVHNRWWQKHVDLLHLSKPLHLNVLIIIALYIVNLLL